MDLVETRLDHPTGQTPPSRLVRFFRQDRETTLYLFEWHMTGGAGIIQIQEFINADVNGAAAVVTARSSKSGPTQWTVSWTRDSTNYEVGLFSPTYRPSDADRALVLARQLR